MTTTPTPAAAADLPEALNTIMEQAEVFASAWSLVGGPFDGGNAFENAEAMKAELRSMLHAALSASAPAAEGETLATLTSQRKQLAETLGACIMAAGIVHKDIEGLSGPQLLMFGEDLREMLAQEAAPQAGAESYPLPVSLTFSARQELAKRHGTKVTPEFNDLVRDAIQSYLAIHAAALRAGHAAPPAQQPSDPMDWPLPCDIKVGHVTIRKGVHLRTLVHRMEVMHELNRMATKATPSAPTQEAAQPAAGQGEAEALLDFLGREYIDLRCFSVRTGQDDGEVGWRTIQHHMGKPNERVVSEVYRDDPRQAIREAIARLKRDPYCTGDLHPEEEFEEDAKGQEGGTA